MKHQYIISKGLLSVMIFSLMLLFDPCPSHAETNAMNTSGVHLSVDLSERTEGFSAILYDNQNGLPTSEANTIVQTSDGFIWIGSYAGLIRYDGNTFEHIGITSGISSIKCLYVDSRDRLWIGTNDNGIAVMENGEFRQWGKLDGLRSAHTRSITEDRNGTIYIATTSGIATIDGDYNLTMLEDDRIAEANMRFMILGPDDLIYGLTNYGDIMTIRDGMLVNYISSVDNVESGAVGAFYPNMNEPGMVYLQSEDYGFCQARMGERLTELVEIDIQPLSVVQMISHIDGKLWICGSNGIGYVENDEFHMLENLPMDNSVGGVTMDYMGNLWFTSTRQGVMKIVPNHFSDLFQRFDLPTSVVNTTCMIEDKLLIGSDAGLMALDDNGLVPSIPLTKAVTASGTDLGADDLIQLLKDCRIRSIIRDSHDRVWISIWRNLGLLRYDHGEAVIFTMEDGLLSGSLRAVAEKDDGKILVALSGGVNIIEGDRVIGSYGENEGISNTESLSVTEGLNGEIVLGCNGGGIYIIDESGVKNINVEDGLPSDVVLRVKRDTSQQVIWIVSSSAIAYMTPDHRITTVKEFPYTNNFDLYKNSQGDMWVLSSNGIYVVPAAELLANDEINFVHYSLDNGLSCIATANSYSELTPEGDLYIAGSSGVCKVNIDQPPEIVSDLKAAVPYVLADGAAVYPDENGVFTIPAKAQKLTVPSFVFNYSLINPQVSYRLEGFERQSTIVRRSDLAPIDYTNLRGGNYRFVMRVMDAMGRGGKEISVQIIKEKAFYEEVWFNIVSVVFLLIILAMIVVLYSRKKTRELEKKNQEEMILARKQMEQENRLREQKRVEEELRMARELQKSALPMVFPPFPDRTEFCLYASMTPAKEVGGDFYDFFLIDSDHLALVIADVSGKGIPAAMFMMMSKTLILNQLMSGCDPATALDHANRQLCEQNDTSMFVTVWLAVLEISTGKGMACNAGHENPAFRRAGGEFVLIKYKHNMVVGGTEIAKYQNHEFELRPGDIVFVFTDGVPEAENAAKEMFGEELLIETLNQCPNTEPEALIRHVHGAVNRFADSAPQFDDITMLCFKYYGAERPEAAVE